MKNEKKKEEKKCPIVGVCAYSFMSPRDQKHIQKGLKHTVDDLKDIADRMTEDM